MSRDSLNSPLFVSKSCEDVDWTASRCPGRLRIHVYTKDKAGVNKKIRLDYYFIRPTTAGNSGKIFYIFDFPLEILRKDTRCFCPS